MKAHSVLVWFTLASLVVTATIAIGFGWLVSRWMVEHAIHDAVREASESVSTIIPQVTSDDFGAPTPSRVAAWQQRLSGVIGRVDIARVKVWNATGQVVYADTPALIGRMFPLAAEEELRAALMGGRPVSDLSALQHPGISNERPDGRLVEIYVPVVLPGNGRVVGAFDVYRKVLPLEARIADIKEFVWRMSAAAFGLLYASVVFIAGSAGRFLTRQQGELHTAFASTIRALVGAVDFKDSYTGSHSALVAEYAALTAQALGLKAEDIEDLRLAAYLHDLGKIGISDEVLQKPDALTPQERRHVRRHPTIAAHILEAAPFSGRLKLAVRHDHERWDGTGYPDGLEGDAIPLEARILCVADAYESMTSTRPYRPTMDHVSAVEELKRHAGTQFDPRVVEAFLQALDRRRAGGLIPEGIPAPHPNPSSIA
jgi:putative nucleotidyltransferase with HDIG domain